MVGCLVGLTTAGCPGPLTFDGGLPPIVVPKPPVDGGPDVPPWKPGTDSGFVYSDRYAADPCPNETYDGVEGLDGGEHTVLFGICVALRQLTGNALLNGAPVDGNIEVVFQSAQHDAQIIRPVHPSGAYDIRVMRGGYDLLKYRPEGIWSNHKGFHEYGFLNMATDQRRDLSVESHRLRGGAFFGGLPFVGIDFPPDVYIRGAGLPPDQHAGSTSVGGAYELALMDGQMALFLNTPPTALQGTELVDYPLTWSYQHEQDAQLDINIPASELEGTITVDGMPLSDRKPGADFQLSYTVSGNETVAAVTHHEGGISGFHSLLPKGKYAINLSFDSIPDRHFPAQLYNKQVVQTVDLNDNATISKNFTTVPIEGGITIDGRSPVVNPGYDWVLYMYAFQSSTEPWFFVYYKIPLDSGSFTLRAFPGIYFVAIQLSDDLATDLADGMARVAIRKEIFEATSLPIEIETALLSGKLLIDGKPPPAGQEAGTLTLQQSDQSFTKRVFTGQDGEFRVRAPKGAYTVSFAINRNIYPEYASGRERMIARLELFEDQKIDLHYDTVPVRGPIRLGGKVIEDTLGGDDVRVLLRRKIDGSTWTWGFPGGTPNFYMRVPSGLYDMSFNVLQDAIPDVAWGTAPLGYTLPALSPTVRPSP
ncbi:MAG: hypothetical protein JNK82_36675 [Myxococcaceae bacterium]|nr:hypothetical protein [Myxococcaceae bacterium]